MLHEEHEAVTEAQDETHRWKARAAEAKAAAQVAQARVKCQARQAQHTLEAERKATAKVRTARDLCKLHSCITSTRVAPPHPRQQALHCIRFALPVMPVPRAL